MIAAFVPQEGMCGHLVTFQALGVLEGICPFLCGDEKCFSELLNLSLSFVYLKKNISRATTDYKIHTKLTEPFSQVQGGLMNCFYVTA